VLDQETVAGGVDQNVPRDRNPPFFLSSGMIQAFNLNTPIWVNFNFNFNFKLKKESEVKKKNHHHRKLTILIHLKLMIMIIGHDGAA
jgi:hypothetical protein